MKFSSVILVSAALLSGVLAIPAELENSCKGKACNPANLNPCCPGFPDCVRHGEDFKTFWCQNTHGGVGKKPSCEGHICRVDKDCCHEFPKCGQHGEVAGIRWCKKRGS